MSRTITLLLATLLVAGCTAAPVRRHYVDYDVHTPWPDEFNWQEQGPADLLVFLQKRAKQKYVVGYSVQENHYGWVRAEDLPHLISLLDSMEPCAPVSMSVSSYKDTKLSTVGHEAAYLIEAFRKGRYPHSLNSSMWRFSDPMDKYRFDQWCERFMKEYLKHHGKHG
jgi:hypothetical protein